MHLFPKTNWHCVITIHCTESLNRDSVQLVWLTDENWVERCMTNERLQAINERIHKLGYNFEVSFQGLSDDSYDEYQKGIDTAKKKGLGDLMWTGYGEEQVEEGTYHRQINQGNLQCLDDWLKTDLGKKLKKEYLQEEWKRITFKGSVYGVRNIKEQGVFSSLVLTGDEKETELLKEKETISLSDFYEWIEAYRINSQSPFYLNWNYMGEEYESFSEWGYIRICEGVYMTQEEKMINIWSEDMVCKLWNSLAKLKQEGRLVCDDSDTLEKVDAGEYPAAFAMYTSEIMDDKYLYLPNGTKVEVGNFVCAVPYVPLIENDVHGITTWSKHKKEAMQLLTIVNTDEELANLLYFGIEGKDYEIEAGKAVLKGSAPDTYCPANPRNTYCELGEVNLKKKKQYYKSVNKKYKLLPTDGFEPNLKKAGLTKELLNEVEEFYNVILENPEDSKELIIAFQKKLKKTNYDEAIKNIQKQYDKWKKRSRDKNEK